LCAAQAAPTAAQGGTPPGQLRFSGRRAAEHRARAALVLGAALLPRETPGARRDCRIFR